MRVASTLTCFAAAGPLLRAPLPSVTTAIHKNDVCTRFASETRRSGEPMLFRGQGPSSRFGSLRVQTKHNTISSAVMTRGGAISKTQTTVYHRFKAFMNKRFFLLGAATMVASARLAPSFGTKGGLLSLAVSKAGECSGTGEQLLPGTA